MMWYENVSMAAWVYLAMHGSYGVVWMIEDLAFPDPGWQKRITIAGGINAWLDIRNTKSIELGLTSSYPEYSEDEKRRGMCPRALLLAYLVPALLLRTDTDIVDSTLDQITRAGTIAGADTDHHACASWNGRCCGCPGGLSTGISNVNQ